MVVDQFHEGEGQASLGSPGLDGLRWVRPVYPDDTLTCESRILSKRRSTSRPDMGIVKTRITAFNQHGEVVMTVDAVGLIEVRDPDLST